MSSLAIGCSIGSLVLCGLVAPATLVPAEAHSATGLGVMTFGEKEDGTGYLDFSFQGGDSPGGSLVFGAEHHDEYPDFVIVLDTVQRLRFQGKSFTVMGQGRLHDDPVFIRASATDNNGKGQADIFRIEAFRGTNEILFEAAGTLVSGDIQVGIDE